MNAATGRLVVEQIRHEVDTPWLLIGAVVVALGGATSIVLGQRELAAHVMEYEELVQARVQAQVRGTGRAFGRTTDLGIRVVRPPSPGAVLVTGEAMSQPAAWDFTPAGVAPLAPYASATIRPTASWWDLELWIRLVGGALAGALGFYGVVTDRRTHWLQVLRSWPIRPSVLGGLRVGAGVATLTLVALAWWAVWSSVLFWRPGPEQAKLWSLLIPALLSLWIAYGAGTLAGWSWLIRPRRGALIGLAWLALVGTGPTLLSHVVQVVAPVSAEGRMVRERREDYADDLRDIEYKLGEWVLALVPAGTTKPSEIDAVATARFADLEPDWLAAFAEARARAVHSERVWRDGRDAQRRWTTALALAVPGVLFRTLMAERAGTGPMQLVAWESAVEVHQGDLNRRLFDNRPTAYGILSIPGKPLAQGLVLNRHEALRLAELPTFQPPADTSEASRARRQQLAALIVWALAVLAAASAVGARVLHRWPDEPAGE